MSRPEHDHERGSVCPFYGGLGIDVYPTSARVWAKGVRKGVPDLICFSPRLGFQFYHESKIEGRRQTKEQYEFEQSCIATNVAYVLGGIEEAMGFAVMLEIADRVGPTVRVRPRDQWPKFGYEDLGEEWARHPARLAALRKFGYKIAA